MSQIHRKFVLVGSGVEGLQNSAVCEKILGMVPVKVEPASSIRVLYIGTATYDIEIFKYNQTIRFVENGCQISDIQISKSNLENTAEFYIEMAELCRAADVILVSGGNTLFAVDCWRSLGLDLLLHEAMLRGCVLCGGSAGAICWFDGGHSDSYDSDSFKSTMLGTTAAGGGAEAVVGGEESAVQEKKSWAYIRVPCLGFLKGLCCPHADKVQSNGLLRAHDLEIMLRRHPGEVGILIDHYCALIIDGNNYEVMPLPGKIGSVMADQSFSPSRDGFPGIWKKEVVEGTIKTTLVPSAGSVDSLLKKATHMVEDPGVDECRLANPIYSHLIKPSSTNY